jgi:nucleotide-binding universal stress UspA family protein
MTSPKTRAGAAQSGRKILLAVNASAESEDALQWTLANMYRPGDVLHFLHVIPRQEPATTYGAPPVDFLPQQNPKSVQRLAEQGLSFIKERLLPMLGDMQPEPVVHVVKVWETVLAYNAGCVLRASPKSLQQQGTNRFVWILQSDTDTDSIGNVVCQRAEALAVVAVVMAGHSKSITGDFFMGSITNFCTHHCKKPVLVVH